MSAAKNVSLIRISLVVDGKQREMTFVSRAKIAELLSAEDSVGSFLRAFRDVEPEQGPAKQ